ncbi:alpha/beta fold hydrolase [Micromonospora sp. NBC_01796]|uniref:alpha/beta fold hydrolase n=1 Tax=Micromonospora sp. NBC_01796 TaxID=2975987 RepID=UPI002DDB7A2B|nr:alpha/beta hydrolase [Micromonospora sp. NBC_01796]WSA85214.1 alpha/beta hydrolase [Micromonospora sp. NBC_01796]
MAEMPTLVLIHGAWHGSWCWERLLVELTDLDVRVGVLPSTGQDPARLGDLRDDVAAVRTTLTDITGPVVVCGHSYGGIPVTEAAAGLDNVRRLVYLSSLPLDAGQSLLDFTNHEFPSFWDVHEDAGYFDVRDPRTTLYQDVESGIADEMVPRLGHQALASATQPVSRAGWREIASTYIICAQDAAFPLAGQETLAQRCESVLRLDSGHSPFLSQPAKLAELLREELTRD